MTLDILDISNLIHSFQLKPTQKVRIEMPQDYWLFIGFVPLSRHFILLGMVLKSVANVKMLLDSAASVASYGSDLNLLGRGWGTMLSQVQRMHINHSHIAFKISHLNTEDSGGNPIKQF